MGAHLPIDGGASGMGLLPMSGGLTQTHGQDARATAGIPMLPSIGRCALGWVSARAIAVPSRVRPSSSHGGAPSALPHSITYIILSEAFQMV